MINPQKEDSILTVTKGQYHGGVCHVVIVFKMPVHHKDGITSFRYITSYEHFDSLRTAAEMCRIYNMQTNVLMCKVVAPT
jgi:hypothetical protein